MTRQQIIYDIKKNLRSHLWESGFVRHGTNKPIMLYAFKRTKKIKGFVLKEIDGFTKDGVILPTIAPCLVTERFSSLPLEDLMLLLTLSGQLPCAL